MSRIFISHATADNAKTCAVIDWIVSQGWSREEIFVDFDLTNGIAGGERWREALERALKRCETCVFLISPAWADSDWCPGEATAAQLLGKQMIPVLIEPTPFDRYGPLLTHEYQLIDLTLAGPRRSFEVVMPGSGHTKTVELAESGLQALRVGLERAGLAPSTFPLVPGRPIYPGLAPLDIDDAAVFFGRDAEIERGLKELRLTRDCGECLLAILAASGAGKSSFLRAGLWPRLQRADTEFLILPVLRPGTHALEALVASLHGAGEALELKRNRADWRAQLEQGDLADALRLLQTAARARLPAAALARTQSTSRPGADAQADLSQTHPNSEHAATAPIPVLPIDQAEELFGPQGGEPARRVLDLLGTALREGRLIALCAIRTDRYASLQTAPALAGLTQRPFSLPPIVEGTLKDVIEGPALRDQKANGAKGLRIDAQLTDRLLHDWADTDGLPLLAFTLRRLLDDYGSDGTLTLKDYEHSGQLRGALEAAIGRAMQAATAAGTLPEGSQEREALIRKTFVPLLVSVDPQSQKPLRRIALRSELPAETRDLIDRLIDARLLTCDRPHDSDATVEVAHEAILHHWPLLERIIGQEREALTALNEVKRDAAAWLASRKSEDATESEDTLRHRGEPLRHAELHLAFENFQQALGDQGRRYLAACRMREAKEIEEIKLQQAREISHIEKTRKLQKKTTILLLVLILVTTIAAFWTVRTATTVSQSNVDILESLAELAFEQNNDDRAIRFALAGINQGESTPFHTNSNSLEIQLKRAGNRSKLRLALKHKGQVFKAIFSPDRRKIITSSYQSYANAWDTRSGRLIYTMKHDDQVWNIAYSPDGTRIVTTSSDETARIWDAASGRLIATLPHQRAVWNASFSRDGNLVATASWDKTARIWNSSNGKLLQEFNHYGRVWHANFSPDGRTIITASSDKNARIWDVHSGALLKILPHEKGVLTSAFSPDGQQIVTASEDNTARTWNTDSGNLTNILPHNGIVLSATYSPDGTQIATASEDKTARIWNTRSPQPSAVVLPHDDVVWSAEFSPDGSKIVTASFDRTARIWDAISGQLTSTMIHERKVTGAAFSSNSQWIVTASADSNARAWDMTRTQPISRITHDGRYWTASVSNDFRKNLTVEYMDNIARIWSNQSGEEISKLIHDDVIWSASFNRDSSRIATASFDKTARVWSASSGRTVSVMKHESIVFSASFSPDSKRIVTAARDKKVRIWNSASGKLIVTMPHSDSVYGASFSPDGHKIVTTSEENKIRVLDSKSGQLLSIMPNDGGPKTASFSPDSNLITSTEGFATKIWNITTGKLIKTIEQDEKITSISFSPNGDRIITVSSEKNAYIWEIFPKNKVAKITHNDIIYSASFSPDGKMALTSSRDKTVRISDASSGLLIATMPNGKSIHDAAFTADGKQIVATNLGQKGVGFWLWEAKFFKLDRANLVKSICVEILNVDIHLPPKSNDLSRLTDEELQMAAVINPKTERDVCRPPTRWQRFASMFGIGG